MMNAGKYDKPIAIYRTSLIENERGFQTEALQLVLKCKASVKTTKGMTLIKNGTDFEKAYTRFTIRYPKSEIDRDMKVVFHGKTYSIEYLNNVDENGIELEMQCKEITH